MQEEKINKCDIIKNEKESNKLLSLMGIKLKIKYHRNKNISDEKYDKIHKDKDFYNNLYSCSCCHISKLYFNIEKFTIQYEFNDVLYKFIRLFMNHIGVMSSQKLLDKTLFYYFYYNFRAFRIFIYHYRCDDVKEDEIKKYLREEFSISKYYDIDIYETMSTLLHRLLLEYSINGSIEILNFEFNRYIDELEIKKQKEKEYNLKKNKDIYVRNRLKDFNDNDLEKIIKYMDKMEKKDNHQ